MARLPRLLIPGQTHHVTQSGVDGKIIFLDADDHLMFLSWLKTAAKQFSVVIHAYALLPDRVHLLLTPSDHVGLGKMMQWLGRYYVPYFNAKYKRSGLLWQGRFKACVLEAKNFFLPCCVMIEESAVRGRLVDEASQYPWSSCQHHLGLKLDALVADHAIYWGLGNTPFQREAAYKEMLEKGVSASHLQAIQDATSKAWLLGSDEYKAAMRKLTERRIEPVKRGRPKKKALN